MTNKEKIKLLEDLWELDEGTLDESMVLENLDVYDSIGKLFLIGLMDDQWGKRLSAAELLSFVTVKDILDYMG